LKNCVDYKFKFCFIISIFLFTISCGGPYKAAKLNQPTRKLQIADELFEKGEYSNAAIEFKDYLTTFAGDERCDYAQFKLAECYRMKEEYPLASVEYRVLINDYGYSEYVDDAFYLEGLCFFRQSKRVERDQTKTFEAKNRIERFMRLFPDSPKRDEAKALLEKINTKLAEKKFMSAKLYYSLGHYDSALLYLDKTASMYGGTIPGVKSHYLMGRIFEKRDQKDKAVDQYKKVISFGKDIDEKGYAEKHLERLLAEGTDGD